MIRTLKDGQELSILHASNLRHQHRKCSRLPPRSATQWTCREVGEVVVRFQVGCLTVRRRARGMHQHNCYLWTRNERPYTPFAWLLVADGPVNILRIRVLAYALEMGLRGSFEVLSAAQTSAKSLPGTPLLPDIHIERWGAFSDYKSLENGSRLPWGATGCQWMVRWPVIYRIRPVTPRFRLFDWLLTSIQHLHINKYWEA